ncbi:MAG: hypothetical protein COA44_08375 [Arcobacter sp.]|nr:MAG: hypothetical protein COA44_08375 [Arcobacter sp.]
MYMDKKQWFSALASEDLEVMDMMLEGGFDANILDDKNESALKILAKKLGLAINDLDWESEKLLKEIAATLILHGAHEEDLGHLGGDFCNISHAITLHVIKMASFQGKLNPILKLIEDGDIWFPEKNPSAKGEFLKVVNDKNIFSIEKMFEYQVVGFAPTQ